MTTRATPPPPAATTGPGSAARGPGRTAYRTLGTTPLTLVFVLLLVSLAARTVFALWEPPFDATSTYDDVRDLPGAFWPMNLYLGGPGYAVSWVSAAVLMSFLARGGSGVITLAGSVLAGVGGVLFALAITSEALPLALAARMPEPQGRPLVDALDEHLDLVVPAIVGATLAIAAGVLLVLLAALWSRALPRWFATAGVVVLLALVLLPPLGRLWVVVGYLVQVVLVAALGWCGLRAGLAAPPSTHPRHPRPPLTHRSTP